MNIKNKVHRGISRSVVIKFATLFFLLLTSSTCFPTQETSHLTPSANLVIYQTIAGEESQNFDSAVAVAKVIRNRAKQRHQTFEQVVLQPRQFSYWLSPRKLTEKEIDFAKKAWAESENSTLEADHYFNPSLCNPKWAKSMIFICRIGEHNFYKSQRG